MDRGQSTVIQNSKYHSARKQFTSNCGIKRFTSQVSMIISGLAASISTLDC